MEIEVDLALKRLADNKALYVHLALSFPRDAAVMTGQFSASMAAGDKAAAAALLHNLKGVASTLGARALAEQVAAVEQRLRRELSGVVSQVGAVDETALQALVADTQAALERVVAELRPASCNPSAIEGKTADQRTDLQRLLAELAGLLENRNMRALSVFAKLQYRFGAHSSLASSPCMAALTDAINGLDFRRALDNCRLLAAELEQQ